MARRSSRLTKPDEADSPPVFLDLDAFAASRKRQKQEEAEKARKKQFREPTSSANRMMQDVIANSETLRDQPAQLYRRSQLDAELSDDDSRIEM
jgi:hypothetical protein